MNLLEELEIANSDSISQKIEREALYEEKRKEEEAKMKKVSFSIEESSTQRFNSSEWFSNIKKKAVTVIGVGGIGSWTVLALARAGVGSIEIYDGDRVDAYNLAGQFYRPTDVGRYKVEAVAEIVRMFAPGANITAYNINYSNQPLRDITITALDSMAARKLIWENYLRQKRVNSFDSKKNCLMIDARMSAEAYSIFTFRMSQSHRVITYEKECLFPDSIVPAQPCSYKATSHIGMGLACDITGILTKHISFQGNDKAFNSNVPFFINKDLTDGFAIALQKTWKIPENIL